MAAIVSKVFIAPVVGAVVGGAAYLLETKVYKVYKATWNEFDWGIPPDSYLLNDCFYAAIIEKPYHDALIIQGCLQPLIAKVITTCVALFTPSTAFRTAISIITIIATGIIDSGTSNGRHYRSDVGSLTKTSLVLGITLASINAYFGLLPTGFVGLVAATVAHIAHNYIFAKVSENNPGQGDFWQAADYRKYKLDYKNIEIIKDFLRGSETVGSASKKLGYVDSALLRELKERVMAASYRSPKASEEEITALWSQQRETEKKLRKALSLSDTYHPLSFGLFPQHTVEGAIEEEKVNPQKFQECLELKRQFAAFSYNILKTTSKEAESFEKIAEAAEKLAYLECGQAHVPLRDCPQTKLPSIFGFF